MCVLLAPLVSAILQTPGQELQLQRSERIDAYYPAISALRQECASPLALIWWSTGYFCLVSFPQCFHSCLL